MLAQAKLAANNRPIAISTVSAIATATLDDTATATATSCCHMSRASFRKQNYFWVHEFAFQTLLLSANIGSNSEGLAHVSQEQIGFLMPDLDGRHVCLAVLGQQHD